MTILRRMFKRNKIAEGFNYNPSRDSDALPLSVRKEVFELK